MPPTQITLIRHGQAEHNVQERYHLPDPILTPLGQDQCRNLQTLFPKIPPVGLLVTSPLKRTIQTTAIAFQNLIGPGDGVPLVLLPELQETSALPCDTGSDVEVVRVFLEELGLGGKVEGLERLDKDWNSKEGKWGSESEELKERAAWVRRWLAEREEGHVVCVSHGGFLHFLTEDWTGHGALPGTGWTNTEFRGYRLMRKAGGQEWGLVETEESRVRRGPKPLGKTERREVEEVKIGEGEV